MIGTPTRQTAWLIGVFIVLAIVAVVARAIVVKIRRDIRKAGELEGRARQEDALRHVAHALTGAFTLDEVLRRITETAAAAGVAESVYLELVDPGGKGFTCAAGYGTDVPETGTKGPYAGSLAAEVLAAAQPRIIRDVMVER